MSNTLHFAEHTLQEVALLIMALVYTTRIIWLLRFKPFVERQDSSASGGKADPAGIAYSLANIAMPWAMESTRRNLFFYCQFVLFHLGVTAAIVLSFIIPYAGEWWAGVPFLHVLFQVIIGGAFLVAIHRIVRRIIHPVMRLISTPDDYFSLILLTVWFTFAFFAVPNDLSGGEAIVMTYFCMTAFFLIYVPFSKISHYLYYPFTRFWLGKTMAHRGVYPMKPGPKQST